MILTPRAIEYRHFQLFCGLGGGAKGFNRSRAVLGHREARLRCIGGVDSDRASIADFSRAAAVSGTVLDLFSADQYRAFHGSPPPDGWREATPDDLRAAAHGERPHIVFGSAPCKGFSGLLPEAASKGQRYQALNQLAVRGLWLALEAWGDDPPEFFLWENVPRIRTRGRSVLDQMIALLERYGYVTRETTHNCGELGALSQNRERFLLVCRHAAKVPPFLYEPVKRTVRSVGSLLERFPIPNDPRGGPMHRMRQLQWRTWVRLAFVEAGSDWRSLNRLAVENGVLADYALAREIGWHAGRVFPRRDAERAGTITGSGRPHNGAFSVADPRVEQSADYGQLGVRAWDRATGAVSGQSTVGGGSYAVADPRLLADHEPHNGSLGVCAWDGSAPTIIGVHAPGQGKFSVADPRLPAADGRHNGVLGVCPWGESVRTIKGETWPTNGPFAVADPRLENSSPRFSTAFRIVRWSETSPAITGQGGAGGQAVADPRTSIARGSGDAYQSARAYGVVPWDRSAQVVAGSADHDNGMFSVADPRCAWLPSAHRNKLKVVGWDAPAPTVIAGTRVDSGALSVADPRADVTGDLPAPEQRLVCVIRALDGTWHRPFTTLELAALQGLVDPGEYLELQGQSDTAWRERIGNCVPPPAAEAIGSVFLQCLLLVDAGETFALSATPVWVQPIAIALSVAGEVS